MCVLQKGIKKGPKTESYNCVVVLEKFRARYNSQEEVSLCLFFFASVSFCLPLTRPLSMSPSSSLFLTQIALPLGSGLARMFSDRLSRQRERRVQTKGHPDCLVRSTSNTCTHTWRERTVTHFVSVRKILLIIAELGASIRHLNAQETAKISLQGCGWHRGSSPSQNSHPYTYTSTCRILYKRFLSNMLAD